MRASALPFVAVTCVLLILVSFASDQDETFLRRKCGVDNYTSKSTYQINLNSMSDSLSLYNDIDYGFYNFSLGEGNDTVHVVALCRGDIGQTACLRCLRVSTNTLPKYWCPSQKEAIVWYDRCMLRYSNHMIFGSMEKYSFYSWNDNDAPEANWFSQVVAGLLSSLQYRASLGDSHKKFAATDTYIANRTRIYGLVQCTPDLAELECRNCLNKSFMVMAKNVSASQKLGGRVCGPSCNFRYESYPFYENSSPTSTSVTPPPAGLPSTRPTNRRIKNLTVIVASTLGFVALLTCICILILLKRRKAKLRSKGHPIFLTTDADDIKSTESLQFDFETIRAATDNFNYENKLGEGGFGSVYKGKLIEGKEIAVKRLAAHSEQGDVEFMNEVILLAKLQHRNLVRLLGYCLEGNERLLIYEFVPNSSLDHFLFDSAKRCNLDWDARYKIITGIAKGLLYLHEDSRLKVIHRDLKAGNILLDEKMCPKIADFGLARLFNLNQTQGDTSRIVGTYGYMAPEYAMHGKFSVKSDVYSFGILLLEIISGQKNSRFCIGDKSEELTSFAWDTWNAETIINFIDPTILKSHKKDILRSIHIGLLCVQDSVSARPTMASVVLMLSSASLALPFPSKPAYLTTEEFEMAICAPSVNQVSVSDMLPR